MIAHVRNGLLAVGLLAGTVGCGSSPLVPPSPVIDDPVVNCPGDIEVTSHSGQNPTVSFDTPTAAKGQAPVSVACMPSSGSTFESGVTKVTCEASDARAHKASCSFSVVITPIPLLSKTKFMAFGDSITEGKTSLVGPSVVVVPPDIFNASVSYVEKLNAKLTTRYQDQTITVIAEGFGGRQTGEDKFRLPTALDQWKPDALLLQEGANDVDNFPDSQGIQSAADALQIMVRAAKSRGVRVFLGNVVQQVGSGFRSSPAAAAAVPTLNDRLKTVAAQEGVTLVDLWSAVPTTMIGPDGLHPTTQGYDVIADEWFKAIVATMEIKP